jgi:hypothetical protein
LARAAKNHQKKYRPLKFFFHRSKLQAGSSKDDYQMKSHLIRAMTRPRPTTACSDQLAVRQKAVLKREKAGSRTGICLVIIIENASLYFGTLEEEFQWAIFFLVVFCCACQSENPDLGARPPE